jgi:FHA domain
MAVLRPFLAALVIGSARADEGAGKESHLEVSDEARRAWWLLRPRLEEHRAAMEAARDTAAHSEDEDARAKLRLHIMLILGKDRDLAHELAQILDEAREAREVAPPVVADPTRESYGPRLLVLGVPGGGDPYALRLGDQVIGRDATSDLVLGSGDVSHKHAYIHWDGTTATVTDAGSRNGTVVNGYRVMGSQALRPGDVLRLGSVELQYEAPGTDRPGPPRIGRDTHGEIVLGNVRSESDVSRDRHSPANRPPGPSPKPPKPWWRRRRDR